MAIATIKKIFLFCLVWSMTLPKVFSQYQITAPSSCALSGVYYGPYTITGGSWGTSDHWCVTGGTINQTTNTCMNNSGVSSIGITWNSGITTGTVSYYLSTSTTPVATFTVTIVANTISQQMSPYNTPPLVPLGQVITATLVGSDVNANPCGSSVNYGWQISTDNVNYTSITGPGDKDYLINASFTQSTYYRRVVNMNGYLNYSNYVQFAPVGAVTPGTISPAYTVVASGTSVSIPFSATAASGGTTCGPGAYTYQWQTSPDNINWTTVGTSASFTLAATVSAKTYIRELVYCGPLPGITNTAVVDVYQSLDGGLISPITITIPSGTSPGILTGNPASYGNASAGYSYLWKYSTDGITFNPAGGANGGLNYTPGVLSVPTWYQRQVSCPGQTAYSNVVFINTTSSTVTNQHYITTRSITAANITTPAAAGALTALADVKQTTTFFDGLGRSAETVMKQSALVTGGLPSDIVACTQYDAVGREPFKYLPYVSTATDGSFKPNALPEQNAFNGGQFPNENYYYSQLNYQASSLDRINNTSAAGANWTGSNRNIQKKYTGNTLNDVVRVWYVTNSITLGVFGSYNAPSIYPAGALYKSITIDENGKQLIEFKDLDGKPILKKVQLTAPADDGSGTGYTGWLCTYYIYDYLNNLRCVVQPHGVELLLQNNWNIAALSNIILNEQCFRYEYDERNRMIMKQVPGTGAVYMIYDNLDRPVMTQDANLRTLNKWLVNLYENTLDRPVATGLFTTSTAFASLKAAAATSTAYPFTSTTTPSSGWELLTVTHYDDYTGIPSGLAGSLNLPANFSTNFYTTYNASPIYARQLTQSTPSTAITTKGLVTWIQAEVLGVSPAQYISSANIYDDRARVIQVQSINITGGVDMATNQYDFTGKLLISDMRHQKLTGTVQNYQVASRNTYDDLGRIVKVEKTIPNTNTWKTISALAYDALGQLKTKSLGINQTTSGPLETQTYDYNIRGWLLGANRNFVSNQSGTNYFGFELGYDKSATIVGNNTTYAISQYNGNVNGTVWKNAGDGVINKYDFTYDAVNRLAGADFNQYTNGTFNKSAGNDFSVSNLNYDANGNILSMNQMGWKLGGSTPSVPIDQLTYTPVPNTNRLQNVIDGSNDVNTTLGDFRSSNTYMTALGGSKTVANASSYTDYTYDGNGNLTTDKNKDITSIAYNYMNLPQTITIAGKGTINYIYDAAGNKLKKIVNETSNSLVTNTLYLYGVYQNDVLQFLPTEEGRTRPIIPAPFNNNQSFAYDYLIKDHLGNTRVVLTDELQQDISPAATVEAANPYSPASTDPLYYEMSYFNINANSTYIVPVSQATGLSTNYPSLYPNNNGNPPVNNNPNCSNTSSPIKQTDLTKYLYRLNSATTATTGLGITLKVMAGDVIRIYGKSYWFYNNSTQGNTNIPLADIITGLLGAPTGAAAGKGATVANLTTAANPTSIPTSFLTRTPTSGNLVPNASINYIFFDEQFKYAGGSMASVVSASAGVLKDHSSDLSGITVPKNGYIYVYISNQSPVDVYFDNLQVIRNRGPILETSNYYPYGLIMAGISDKTIKSNYSENKYRYNGKELQNREFSDGTGLEEYDYGARMYDPQIGRWAVPDAASAKALGWSPYRYGFDNPVRFLDPSGNYETDGHFWTVYLMATMMGSRYAFNIAYWTETPDHMMSASGDPIKATNTWLNPLNQGPMHALTGGYAPWERVESALAVGESTSTHELGLALHRLGDSYAHSTIADGNKMYDAPLGHVYDMTFGTDPDKIANRPALYKEYVSILSAALGYRLNFSGNIDKFTFNYVADNKGSTEQNSAILETEVRIRQGAGVFSVAGDEVGTINKYLRASNDHFGRNVQADAVYTTVDVYNKSEDGTWVKTTTEQRTFITIHQ